MTDTSRVEELSGLSKPPAGQWEAVAGALPATVSANTALENFHQSRQALFASA